MIFDHAAAFSIARRDSEKNEPDFLRTYWIIQVLGPVDKGVLHVPPRSAFACMCSRLLPSLLFPLLLSHCLLISSRNARWMDDTVGRTFPSSRVATHHRIRGILCSSSLIANARVNHHPRMMQRRTFVTVSRHTDDGDIGEVVEVLVAPDDVCTREVPTDAFVLGQLNKNNAQILTNFHSSFRLLSRHLRSQPVTHHHLDKIHAPYCAFNHVDTTAVSESYCSSLLHSERGRLVTDKPLPDECRQFASIRDALHQHSTTSGASDIAFAGMHAGEAQIAQAARAHGNLAPAQIKRRLTNRSKKTESSWFH